MFTIVKAACAVLALTTSLVSATITIQTTSLKGNATNTITWTSSDLNNDPLAFTIELANPTFRNNFALVNNVGTASGSATFTLPDILPGPNYSIQFVSTSNVSDIFAQTGPFTIVENDVGTSAANAASTTITSALTSGGIVVTLTSPVAASSSAAASSSPSGVVGPSVGTSPPPPVSFSAPSSISTPSVSTTGAPAASSAAPSGAGILQVPFGFLLLGLAAAGMM